MHVLLKQKLLFTQSNDEAQAPPFLIWSLHLVPLQYVPFKHSSLLVQSAPFPTPKHFFEVQFLFTQSSFPSQASPGYLKKLIRKIPS